MTRRARQSTIAMTPAARGCEVPADLGALVDAHQSLEADGRHLLIVNVPRGPRRAFEFLGLVDLMHYDREDA